MKKKKRNKQYLKTLFFILMIIIIFLNNFKLSIYINNNYNYIPIAFAVNNKYLYPLIVLLTSIIYNAGKNTYYIFHVMFPYDFLNNNKRKILFLSRKYKKSKIIFHNLKKKYIDWRNGYYHSQTVYFRLSLPDLIKDLDKIIYLDCDTIVHKDLVELYNLDIKNNYYMGFPAYEISCLEINGTRNFINSGVILINLKLLRKINSSMLFEEYYKVHGTKKVDEYLINILFYNKISFLPFKFGLPDFLKGNRIIGSPRIFYHNLKGYSNGTEKEMIESSINRSITHGSYIRKKWWNNEYNSLTSIGKQWIFYASKSNIFNEICNEYKQYKKICQNLKKI